MDIKILVYATEVWKTREAKHKRMEALMMRCPDIKSVTFDTVLWKGGKPKITTNGKIDHQYFEDNFSAPAKAKGYHGATFSFSMVEGRRWGLDSGVRGSNIRDLDFFGESWVRSDEKSIIRFKDGTSRDRYEKVVPHEYGHEFKNQGFTTLDIHDYDYQTDINNLEGFFEALRLTRQKQINSLWGRILDLTKKKLENWLTQLPQAPTTLLHPVEDYKHLVSQPYGAPVPANMTKVHIGTDWACPVGTPVRAPWDGEVTVAGNSAALGNFCHFKYTFRGVTYMDRFMHLSAIPTVGSYKRGEIIELSGKTGKVTGPHLHGDCWYNDVRLDLINKNNWSTLTVDPQKHYV